MCVVLKSVCDRFGFCCASGFLSFFFKEERTFLKFLDFFGIYRKGGVAHVVRCQIRAASVVRVLICVLPSGLGKSSNQFRLMHPTVFFRIPVFLILRTSQPTKTATAPPRRNTGQVVR
jgi:hypothetical protein